MKFIVAQTGARRGYAVPLILHQHQMLERFYTDLCADVGVGKSLIGLANAFPFRIPFADRLSRRKIPKEILDRTYSFGGGSLKSEILRYVNRSTRKTQKEAALNFGLQMAQQGFGKATHVYTMQNEATVFAKKAKAAGLKVASEIYIALSTHKVVCDEIRMFPDWEVGDSGVGRLPKYNATEYLLECPDVYVCASEFVRDDLVRNWGIDFAKTAVVPYGMNKGWLGLEPRPQVGRILFVGTAGLRKGIHYLAKAAEILKQRGRDYEFRVAGHVSKVVRSKSVCGLLTFLGRVPRHEIEREFQSADVFTLPSLAEGSAEVTYEALASALPCVVTPETGSVVRDNVDGKIVQARDPIALATALEEIVEDRELRSRFSHAARERATDYTWERYGDRLTRVLTTANL